jgi:hypothetical protein
MIARHQNVFLEDYHDEIHAYPFAGHGYYILVVDH